MFLNTIDMYFIIASSLIHCLRPFVQVYHNFHDEVDSYRQHWWRCEGPCRSRPPYFGYVKRAMNRPPSSQDLWWPNHMHTCGGQYTKVKEPDGFGKKKKAGLEKLSKSTRFDFIDVCNLCFTLNVQHL